MVIKLKKQEKTQENGNIFFAFILPFIGVLHLIGCKV